MNSINGVGGAIVTEKKTLTAAATGTQGGWQNNTGKTIMVSAAIDVRTVATGAATLDIGVATTDVTNDGLLDGIDVNAAVTQFASPAGTNGRTFRKLASGGYVSVFRASGDPTGMVADLYVTYYEID
jgi:hypothetical protein